MGHLKTFVSLLVMVMVIFGTSQIGPPAYHQVFGSEFTIPDGTTIASFDVSGKTKQEAENLVTQNIQGWIEEHPVVIQWKDGSMDLPPSFIIFNRDQTFSHLKMGAQNPINFKFDEKALDQWLEENTPDVLPFFQKEVFLKEVKDDIENLEDELTYNLYTFLPNKELTLYESIAKYSLSIPDKIDEEFVSKTISTIEIEPGDFSFKKFILDRGLSLQDHPLEIHTIASLIYGALLSTNVEIIEHHTSEHLPSYLELGREAYVDDYNDLILHNPNSYSLLLEPQKQVDFLVLTVKGYPFLKEYEVKVKQIETEKSKVNEVYKSTEGQSYTIVSEKGIDGYTASVYRYHYADGMLKEKEWLSKDIYSPIDRVLIHYVNPNDSSDGIWDKLSK